MDNSENVILKAISKFKPSKLQGPDNLHRKLIKECAHHLLTPLKEIFSISLAKTKIPDICKRAYVTAIHKRQTNSKNYRPITSVACNVMERLIRDKMVDHMTQNKLFSPYQHGFIPGKSCITQLLETLEEITDAMDQGYDVDIIYLDYTKAFNKERYGIRGKIYSWIKDFLKNRTQRVAVNGCFSSYENVTSGIPQGSLLRPILLVIFINDLPYVIQVMMRLYADDSNLLRRLKTPDRVNQVQASVN